MSEDTPIVVKVREACEILGLTRPEIYYLIEQKILEATKIGSDWRITVSSIQKQLHQSIEPQQTET